MIQIKTIITCDHCGRSYTYSRAPHTKAKFNYILDALREAGWLIEKRSPRTWVVYCPYCSGTTH